MQLSVSLQAGLPQVPWWEARPAWILFAVRGALAAWGLLGAAIWLRESRTSSTRAGAGAGAGDGSLMRESRSAAREPARDPAQADKGAGKAADAARADKPKRL